jgi:hypothetical protein
MPQPDAPSPFTRAGDVPVATMRSSYAGPTRRDPRTGEYTTAPLGEVEDPTLGRVGNSVRPDVDRPVTDPPLVARITSVYRECADGAPGDVYARRAAAAADAPEAA